MSYAQKVFTVRQPHSEKCRYPHPEYAAPSSGVQRTGNARDRTCPDSGCKCGREALKTGKTVSIAFFAFSEKRGYHFCEQPQDMYLRKPQADAQIYPACECEQQNGYAPDKFIYGAYCRINGYNITVQGFAPFLWIIEVYDQRALKILF